MFLICFGTRQQLLVPARPIQSGDTHVLHSDTHHLQHGERKRQHHPRRQSRVHPGGGAATGRCGGMVLMWGGVALIW